LFIPWKVIAAIELMFDGSKLNFDLSVSFSVSILFSVFILLFCGYVFVPISFICSCFMLSGLQHYYFLLYYYIFLHLVMFPFIFLFIFFGFLFFSYFYLIYLT
jgi:hypothetical protein